MTQVAGVNTLISETKDEVDSCAEFYSEEEHQQENLTEDQTVKFKTDNEDKCNDVVDQKEEHKQDASPERLNGPDDSFQKRRKKKKKGKSETKSRSLQFLVQKESTEVHINSQKERTPLHNQDTMSDQGLRRSGRKLNHRSQMKKYHSLDRIIEQSGHDRLQQKIIELEDLLIRPLADTHKMHISQQQLVNMVKLQHHHGRLGHEAKNSQHMNDAWTEVTVPYEEDQDQNQAYSTIRVLQTVVCNPSINSASINKRDSPRLANNHKLSCDTRSASKPPIPQRHKNSVNKDPISNSEKPQSANDNMPHDKNEVTDSENSGKIYKPIDMHLKFSDNPKLREWLKHKDAEFRQSRKAERVRKRQERNDKMVERELKLARREKSAEHVEEWLEVKRKETIRWQREERRRKRQEEQERAMLKSRCPNSGVKGNQIDRPQTAPASKKKYVPIKRPESAPHLDTGDASAPKPPDLKFIYKRPVSGRVRLMKMQNARNSQVRHAEEKRCEELSAEEKQKRARTSYDAWLLAKRKEDIEKHKEAKRQKELTKSDPELERLIPEMAARVSERIKNGKKSSFILKHQVDKDANRQINGENSLEEKKEGDDEVKNNMPKSAYYKLAVNGEAMSMVELNTRARSTSSKTRVPIPQSAFSPRRPKSGKVTRTPSPKVKAIMETDYTLMPNPYKLPFPGHLGIHYHVKRVQEKFFSNVKEFRSDEIERPEPQGCASNGIKTESYPKGLSGSIKPNTTLQTSMTLLKEIEAAAIQSEQKPREAESEPDECTLFETLTVVQVQTSSSRAEEQEQNAKETAQDTTEKEMAESEQTEAEINTIDKRKEYTENDGKSHKEEEKTTEVEEEIQEEEGTNAEEETDGLLCQEATLQEPVLIGNDLPTACEEKSESIQDVPAVEQHQEIPEIEADSSLSMSAKHVSFSECLTSVYEHSSTETSSNFDDDGDKEEEIFMSLDDLPD